MLNAQRRHIAPCKRSAHGRDAWACADCAAKLDRYRPFQRLTSTEAMEAR